MLVTLTNICAALVLVAMFALATAVYCGGLILIAGFWGVTMPLWLGLVLGSIITLAKMVDRA